jgi:hypothetical protein
LNSAGPRDRAGVSTAAVERYGDHVNRNEYESDRKSRSSRSRRASGNKQDDEDEQERNHDFEYEGTLGGDRVAPGTHAQAAGLVLDVAEAGHCLDQRCREDGAHDLCCPVRAGLCWRDPASKEHTQRHRD